MKIIILAAGRGVRLGTLTEQRPKCLLPLGNETVLNRQLRLLEDSGIKQKDITIVAGYKAETITELYNNVIINDDYYKTDNSYSLFLALKNIDDDIIIMDGDLVFDKDFAVQLLCSDDKNVLYCQESQLALGDTGVDINSKGNVCAVGKHIGYSPYSYIGVAKLSKEMVKDFTKRLLQNAATWYTIPLDEMLEQYFFKAEIVKSRIIGINTFFDYINAKNYFGIENFCIMVTGASGLLGKKIYHILKREYRVIGIKHKSSESDFYSLDLQNFDAVRAFFELNHPKVVINCAGIAEPDICEENRELAYKINVETVDILCRVCEQYNCKLIHISTDYVFDGLKTSEYEVDDIRTPQNYYGFTKVEAENIVAKYPSNLIVRIPIIYGYNDSSDKETFPIKVLTALKDKRKLFLDNKQIRFPVLIDEVALMLGASLSLTGILHISSAKAVTKFTWAKVIAREFGYDENLICENPNSNLENRPPHTKMALQDCKYLASDIERGAEILKKQMFCVFKLIYSTHPGDYIYGMSVGEYRYRLGHDLGMSLGANIIRELDYIVPVPSSGIYYAMGMAEATKIPFIQGLYKSDTSARSFQIADNHIREKLIHSKIMPIKELIKDKVIALVDEAIFTGTTLKVVCDICKACGVKKIYICIPTPPCYNRCNQYVRPERALLAEYIDINELKNYFKVEDIFFQPYEKFRNSIKDINAICYDCFNR